MSTATLRTTGYSESPDDRTERLREVILNDGDDRWPVASATWVELQRVLADGEMRTGYEWAGMLPDASAPVVKNLLFLAWKEGKLESSFLTQRVEEAPDLFVVRKYRAYRTATA